MKTPSGKRRIIACVAAFVTTVAALTMTGQVEAGGPIQAPPNVRIAISVYDPDNNVQDVIDELTPELFSDPGGDNVAGSAQCYTQHPTPVSSLPPNDYDSIYVTCSLSVGNTFRLGDASPPDGFSANVAYCYDEGADVDEAIPGDDAIFTLGADDVYCELYISPTPTLYVDKVVSGGLASAGDFPIEIYDADGTQVDIGAVTDPADAVCSLVEGDGGPDTITDTENCVAIPLANGSYTMGEILPTYGYVADQLDCAPVDNGFLVNEKLRSPAFDFVHSPKSGDTYCTITNTYVTDTISVDLVVVNDSGRDANGSEFTIEVYDNAGGLIDSKVDPEPGTGNASAVFDLPIGPYALGFSGPEGYDGSAEIIVDDRPREIITGAEAQFVIGDDVNSGTITVDDQPLATTTTSTTTSTTTTAAPSTLAPTTASTVDPNAVLPATGSSNTTTWTMLLIALGCLSAGGLTIAGARRR